MTFQEFYDITILISLALSTWVLFISLMQLVNGAKFLHATHLSLSSACLTANNCAAVLGLSSSGSGPTFPIIFMFPLTRIYASL